MNVVILGCGPAGLLAAHGATVSGYDPIIVSVKAKSQIGGAQFIHKPLPDINVKQSTCKMQYAGDRQGYAQKVYGNEDADTSWGKFVGDALPIWPMREIYDKLWDKYQHTIYDEMVTPADIRGHLLDGDTIISTIPLNAICEARHDFRFQEVFLTYQYKEWENPDLNWVLYNGDKRDLWYRHSRLFGWESYEYAEMPYNGPELLKIRKPISTNCDCWKDTGLTLLGRYGKWDKWQLSHDAYFGTVRALALAEQR